MTFTPVGSFLQAALNPGPGTISLNNQGIGNLILLAAYSDSSTNWVNSVTGGGATWTQISTRFTGSTNARTATIWAGTVTATGAQTATLGITGGSPNIRAAGLEFSSTVGSWALDVQSNLDGTGTNTWPSLTPSGSGELYFGFAIDSGSAVAGATSGYTYHSTTQGNGAAWNPSVSAASAPVWGDSGHVFGSMILVKETGGVAHNDTAALTVTPVMAMKKGVGLVPVLTVAPARVMTKGVGVKPAATVTPRLANTVLGPARGGAQYPRHHLAKGRGR